MAISNVDVPTVALEITLLGSAAIRSPDGREFECPGRRSAIALARLALASGRTVSRDEIAEAIWGEDLPGTWKAALRNGITELRATLTRAGIPGTPSAAGPGYRLDVPGGFVVDLLVVGLHADAVELSLREGRAAEALERAQAAVEIAARPLLPGADSEWVEGERARLAQLLVRLLRDGAAAGLEIGDLSTAERFAARAVDADPFREDGYRLLMRVHAAAGNRAAVLAAYDRCADVLRSEVGIEPSEETQRLRRQLAADAIPAAAIGGTPAVATWRRTLEYGLRMGRAALAAGEYDDAASVVERTLTALRAAGDPDPAGRLDLLILLAACRRALGHPETIATLDEALAAAREQSDAERFADALLMLPRGGTIADEHYVDNLLLERYQEALNRLPDDDLARRAELLGHLAVAHAYSRSGAVGERHADEAVAMVREVGDDACRLRVLMCARRCLSGGFRLEKQEQLEDEILAVATQLDDPAAQASGLLWRFMTRIEQGRGEDLEPVLAQAEAIIAGLRMGHYHHSLAYLRAVLSLLRGHEHQAERDVAEAAALGLERGLDPGMVEALRLAQMLAMRCDQGRLSEIHDEALALFGGSGEPLWLSLVGILEADAGHDAAALAALTEFLDVYEERGPALIGPIGVAAYTASTLERLGARDLAERLYEQIAPWAGYGGYFAYFSGPIDYHLAVLTRMLGRHEEAVRHLDAADAFCRRIGAPLWAQRVEARRRQT